MFLGGATSDHLLRKWLSDGLYWLIGASGFMCGEYFVVKKVKKNEKSR